MNEIVSLRTALRPDAEGDPAQTKPTVIVTGLKRAGLQLLADMLREGGVPDEPFKIINDLRSPIVASEGVAIAPDPHRIVYLPLHPRRRIGLYIDRSSSQIIRSIERENAAAGRAKLSPHEIRILRRQLVLDLHRARDEAALAFSPMFMFRHDDVIDEPQREANRLARIVCRWWPHFSAPRAALAIRRIAKPPRIVGVKPRLVASTGAPSS